MNTVVLSVFVVVCSVTLVTGRAFNPSAWNLSFKDDDFKKKASMPIAAPVWFLRTDKQKKGVMPASLWFHNSDDGDFRKRQEEPFGWNEIDDNNLPGENDWHRSRRDVAEQIAKLWRQHLTNQKQAQQEE